MIALKNKSDCSGCTACQNICPHNCIHMKADEEGFLYPYVEIEKCIQCKACEKVCPILQPVKEEIVKQKAYLVQHKNEAIRVDSSAGGAFTAIATSVLNRGGVVYGAAYDEKFQVHHRYVEDRKELYRFRNSKYVQSILGDSFKQVKQFLLDGRWVCFSGTPCQIEGLSKYLGKKYERLVLVDVVCYGIPSPLVWNKYLEYQKIAGKKIENIRFRDKFYGYKYSTMSIIQNGEKIYHAGSQSDPMLRSFVSNMSVRPACYECHFKKQYRVSDITIWDCFSVREFDKTLDDDKGTTKVLCHSEKGIEIIQDALSMLNYREVQVDEILSGTKAMYESIVPNPRREQFFTDAQNLSGDELLKKYFPITAMTKMKTVGRKILLYTGAYSLTKRWLNKLKNS